jgi:hypothetical protein
MARLSGTWTLTAITKLAGWDQRVVITGSDASDGAHPMVVGTVIPAVRGVDFDVKTQALNPGTGVWLDSFQIDVMSWDPVKGVVVTISSDDRTATPDRDFNDLVVECTSSDPALLPPRYVGPRLDLSIPEKYVRQKETKPKRRRPRPTQR